MRKNRSFIAFAVLIALLGLAVWKTRQTTDDATTTIALTDALPSVAADDVDALVIRRFGAPDVRLEKRTDQWRLVEPIAADAEVGAVQAALTKLSNLDVVGVAATLAKNHERLEVTQDTATHVTAHRAGQPMLDVFIGGYRSGHTMVRESDEERVLMVKGSVRAAFDKSPKDWRDRRVVDIQPEHVVTASFESNQGRFRFVRADGEWKQVAGEKVIPRFEPSKVEASVAAIAQLRAVDFPSAELTEEGAGLATPAAMVTLGARIPQAESDADGPSDGTSEQRFVEETVVLRVGNAPADNANQRYVKRATSDVLYLVSKYVADRMEPTAASFQGEDPKALKASAK